MTLAKLRDTRICLTQLRLGCGEHDAKIVGLLKALARQAEDRLFGHESLNELQVRGDVFEAGSFNFDL